jgi:hypothetical protein
LIVAHKLSCPNKVKGTGKYFFSVVKSSKTLILSLRQALPTIAVKS